MPQADQEALPDKCMTIEEYVAFNIKGWHLVEREDGGLVNIKYGPFPPDLLSRLDRYEKALGEGSDALHNAVLSLTLQLSPDHEDAIAGARALATMERALQTQEAE